MLIMTTLLVEISMGQEGGCKKSSDCPPPYQCCSRFGFCGLRSIALYCVDSMQEVETNQPSTDIPQTRKINAAKPAAP
ncbi:hypothetical protein SOVF_111870 [Spinacia oleracea]|nr:hypothetical protein SOVF_111870 [Spinacia oleracea]